MAKALLAVLFDGQRSSSVIHEYILHAYTKIYVCVCVYAYIFICIFINSWNYLIFVFIERDQGPSAAAPATTNSKL